ARISSPLVTVLDLSGRGVLHLVGQHAGDEERITDDEIKALIAEAEGAGVLRLGDRPIRGVMTPRTEVEWLDLRADASELRQMLIATRHSRLPAGNGIDELLGV